jgi:hypothetical protein
MFKTLVIMISNQVIPVDSIVVSAAQVSTPVIREKNGTLLMVAEIIPENASNKTVEWSIENNTEIAAIDSNGLVTGKSNGSVKVIATAIDGSNVSGFCTVAIINQSNNTNLSVETNQELKVYQSSDKLIFQTNNNISANYYTIYSVAGNIIHKGQVVTDPMIIDLSSCHKGIYILSLIGNHTIEPLKIVIQ